MSVMLRSAGSVAKIVEVSEVMPELERSRTVVLGQHCKQLTGEAAVLQQFGVVAQGESDGDGEGEEDGVTERPAVGDGEAEAEQVGDDEDETEHSRTKTPLGAEKPLPMVTGVPVPPGIFLIALLPESATKTSPLAVTKTP